MSETTLIRIQAYGRSGDHVGPIRRCYAYQRQTARGAHPRGIRPQRHTQRSSPLLASMMNKVPRAAAVLVAAALAIDLVRLLMTQPVG